MADDEVPAGDLDDDEMIGVLQDIIRNGGNAAARIAAIKQLREIRASQEAQTPAGDEFGSLYAVESPRLRGKGA